MKSLIARSLVGACAVVLLGVSYLLGEPAIGRWRAAVERRQKLGDERKLAQRLIAQRGDWESRYQQQRADIPVHGVNDPVSAVLLTLRWWVMVIPGSPVGGRSGARAQQRTAGRPGCSGASETPGGTCN